MPFVDKIDLCGILERILEMKRCECWRPFFQIDIQVCDQTPSVDRLCSNKNGMVNVTILRNRPPFFHNLPYSTNLGSSFSPDDFVVKAEGGDLDSNVRML